jgi:hypothetical protein
LYVLTLIAVAGGRTVPPAAVGRPYKKQSARGRNDAARGSVVLALLGLAVPVLAFAAGSCRA